MADNIRIAVILTALDKMSAVVDSAVSKTQAKLNKISDSAMKTGRSLTAAGLAVGAPLYGAIQQAMDFEQRMVDIRKQMDVDTPETVKKMTEDVMMLGKQLPLATAEIQDMIASGLRMGIAQEKIIDYTRDVTKMAVAFDMPADLIADSMGKISNVFKIPIEKVGDFADAINYLDDNTMAKGPELIETLQRIGGAAKYLDPKDAAALASTMLSLGESAETSGSGISAMINRLGAANMGSKRLQKGLEMLSLQSNDLQKRMSDKSTAKAAIIDVFERINKLDASKQTEVLVRLFGQEHGPKLQKLTNNMKEFQRQLELVQGQEKGSMDKEYAKRIDTAAAKWQIFRNKLREVAIVSGSTLIPAFNKVLESVGKIMERVSNFVNKNPELTATIGKIAAGFAAVSLGGAGVSFAIGGVAKALSMGISVVGGMAKAIGFLSTTFQALQLMISFGGGPIIWAVMAIAAAAFLIIKYWDPIKKFFTNLWNNIKEGVTAFITIAKNLFLNFTPVGLVIKHWEKIKPFFTAIWDFIKNVFKLAITGITYVLLNFTPVGLIITHWQRIKGFFTAIWDFVKSAFQLAVTAIGFVLMKFTPAGLIIRHWNVIKSFFSTLWAAAGNIISKGVEIAKNLFLNFTPYGLVIKHWEKIIGFFHRIVASIKNFASQFFDAGKQIIDSIIRGITSKITAVTDKIKEVTQKIRDHFPFSPAKAGPLRDINRIRLVETIAENIKPASLVSKVREVAEVAIKPMKAMVNSVGQPMKQAASIPQQRRGGGGNGPAVQPVFNITMNGVSDKSQVVKMTDEMKRQFNRWMKEYESQRMRVSF